MNLFELIVIILIVGVVSATAALPMLEGIKLWQFVELRDRDVWKARVGMDRMVREMLSVKDDRSVTTATATTFAFTTGFPGNEAITFSYNAGSKVVNRNGNTLIGGVSAFTLTYYKHEWSTAAPIVGASNDTDIWAILIDMTITTAGRTMRLKEYVRPRSFLRENK